MTIYYTADTHFGHRNILRFCQRPFDSVDEMQSGMIARWNAAVTPEDTVYHLGDFAYHHPKGSLDAIFAALNGTKHLLMGNHDHDETLALPWASQSVLLEVRDEINGHPIEVILCHYSLRTWNHQQRGSLNLYGHSHRNLPDHRQGCDVGVDCWDYRPVSLTEIASYLLTQPLVLAEGKRALG